MLASARLILRAVEPTDADFMFEVENDPLAWRYSDTVAPLSRHQLRDYAFGYDADPFSAGQLRLIILEKDTMLPVGIADIYDISPVHKRAYVGIYILKEKRGQNYASEALARLCDYASESLLLHSIWARIEEMNLPSEKAFEKAGFCHIATLPDWLCTKDGFTSVKIFSKKL